MKVESCTPEALRRVNANPMQSGHTEEEFLYLVDDEWVVSTWNSHFTKCVYLCPVYNTDKWEAYYDDRGLGLQDDDPDKCVIPDEVIDLMRATYNLMLT